jgi:hypothetical protein
MKATKPAATAITAHKMEQATRAQDARVASCVLPIPTLYRVFQAIAKSAWVDVTGAAYQVWTLGAMVETQT